MIFSSDTHCILELVILTNMIVLSATQGRLTATERKILEGFTGSQDGQVHLFDQTGRTNLPDVLTPESIVIPPDEQVDQAPHVVRSNLPNVLTPESIVIPPDEQVDQAPHVVVVQRKTSSVSQGSGVHADSTGEHGTNSPIQAVHKPGTDTHLDITGQLDNQSSVSVVYQENRASDVFGQMGHQLPISVVNRQSAAFGDLPDQHGNESPYPVVQRQYDSRVDLPSQRGNELANHVIHRQSSSVSDLPGQYSEKSPFPTVHRDRSHFQSSGQQGPLSQTQGTHTQILFTDHVSGTPVRIPGQNRNIGSFSHGYRESDAGVNRLSLDSVADSRHLYSPRVIPNPQARRRFSFQIPRPRPRPRVTQFPGNRNYYGSFPGSIGPPPFLLPPEARRIPGRMIRHMRRRMIMGRLPPPFPSLPPSPAPRPPMVGLGGFLAGAFRRLFGSLFG